MVQSSVHKITVVVLWVCIPIMLFSQKKAKSEHGVTLHFHHYVGDKLLVLDDSTYVNDLNQSYTITKFNYYIGKIRLTQKDGKEFLVDQYYFISEDEEKQASKTIHLDKIPVGEYTSIQFLLGVDSLHNCSGAQSGALDPIHAMFWTWNTGYIFLKLEGKSTLSNLPGNTLEYHIGGYKKPANCIRTITLTLDTPLVIVKKKQAIIDVKTDVSEILKTPETVDFSKLPAVNNALNATTIADNYQDMFHIMTINP